MVWYVSSGDSFLALEYILQSIWRPCRLYNDIGVFADCMSSGFVTNEPVNAYNNAYVKNPNIKYTSVIITNAGVIFDPDNNKLNTSASRNTFAETIADITIKSTCIIPIKPIPIVFPSTFVLGLVDVTNVSIIFDVFSVVIYCAT